MMDAHAYERERREDMALEAITLALVNVQRAGFSAAVTDALIAAKEKALRERVQRQNQPIKGPRHADV